MRRYVRRAVALFAAAVLMMGLWVLPTVPTVTAETSTDIVKIACIGASTTLGNGSTSWPAEAQKLVGGLCEMKNFGVNSRTVIADGTETGDTTQKLAYTLTNEYASSLAYQADYVLIMLGGNDAKPVNWKDGDNTFVEDYKALVAAYQEQGAEVIVVIEPWVKSESWGINEPTMANGVRPAYKAVAEEMGLKTIDLFTPTENQGSLYSDGVHMNNAGYKVLGEAVSTALNEFGIVPEGSEDVPCRPSSSIADFYGEFDGYEVMQWKNGTTGYFNYTGGMLASQMGIEESTVVKNLTIHVSYYFERKSAAGDWWHFNTTDKDGLSAPNVCKSSATENPHDNGFGHLEEDYEMVANQWDTLTVSRDEQTLGGSGSDWYVNVGGLGATNSLYIRGFEVIATLEDDTVKTVEWGTMKGRHGAADGETLKVACVGASTTRGNNVPSDKGTSYPAFLQMMLGNTCEVKNFGYPGASATKRTDNYAYLSYIDSTYHKDSLAYEADIVIIDIGVNDSQTATWNMGTFQKDYEELVLSYLNQENEPLVLLSTGGHCTMNTWDTTDSRIEKNIQPAQIEVAEKYGLPMADMRALLLSDPDAYVCKEDGVHYTDLGHQAMAQLYYDTLLPLIDIPVGGEDGDGMMDPPDCAITIGDYDGYRCLMWENGQTGGFSYGGGALAFALGVDAGTVVEELTITLSYFWDYHAGGNDWWHFNTTDKDGLTAPSVDGNNAHDNGFGTFSQYGMTGGKWNELVVTREQQLLGAADWAVNVGDLNAANSLYIRGFKVTATLADGTVKEGKWGAYAIKTDKTALEEALESAEIDLSFYTAESVAVFTAARDAAKAVMESEIVTQEEIDAAAEALQLAQDALEDKPWLLLGDTNVDGKVNTTDARGVLQYAAGIIDADALDIAAADTSGDGKVNTTDARLILQYAAGIITEFPNA